MKNLIRISALIFSLLLLFSSCGGHSIVIGTPDSSATETVDTTKARIAVLNGPTGFGMAPLSYQIETDPSSRAAKIISTIDYLEDATLISPRLINGEVDIAAVPTNLAAVLYNKTGGEVQVLGLNTLGVLYVLDTGMGTAEHIGLTDLAGQTVSVPGTGTNPEYVLRAILKKKGLLDKVKIDDSNASPDALGAAVLSNKAQYALLPEPKISVTQYKYLSAHKNMDAAYHCDIFLDISKEWKDAFGCDLVQGCFVVRKKFAEEHTQVVKAFIEEYVKACGLTEKEKLNAITGIGLLPDNLFETPLAYTTQTAEEYKKQSYRNLLAKCNLVAQFGEEIKKPLKTYWQALYDIIPSSVGGKMPDDGIFCILPQ